MNQFHAPTITAADSELPAERRAVLSRIACVSAKTSVRVMTGLLIALMPLAAQTTAQEQPKQVESTTVNTKAPSAQPSATNESSTLPAPNASQETGSSKASFTPGYVDANDLRKFLRYPEGSLERNVEGAFEVIAYINAQGEITLVNFLATETGQANTMNELFKTACQAVKRCKATPAFLNNTPVHSAVRIPIKFIL